MKNFFSLFLISLIFIFSTSVHAAKKNKTIQQAAIMQSKDFNASYKTLFKSTMSVLQDNNMIISSANYDAGLIHAQSGGKAGFGVTKKVSVTVNVEEMGASHSKLRINMMLTKGASNLYLLGSTQSESGKPVQDEAVYQRFFQAVEKELFTRNTLSK